MARVDGGVVGKAEEHIADGPEERGRVPARQVCTANRSGKQRVADEQRARIRTLPTDRETDAARAMPGRVMNPHSVPAKRPWARPVVEEVHGRLRLDGNAKSHPLLNDRAVQKIVVAVQPDRYAERRLRTSDAGDVIQVRVRQQDVPDVEPLRAGRGEKVIDLVAGVDHNPFTGFLAADHVSVLEEWGRGAGLEEHMSLSRSHFRITSQESTMDTRPLETRIHGSALAAAEKRLLIWIARRLPSRVTSDQLTALGAVALLGVGICYWLGPVYPAALVGVVVLLAANWFGDSLDGTLARVRRIERPRYGFYVDHVLDAVGILFIIGGLIAGGYMSAAIGAAFLVVYYLLTIEIALATHALGTFRLSYWKVGPTELRILLAVGTLMLLRGEYVNIAGMRLLLFDAGGAVAVAGLIVTFVCAAVGNARELSRREPRRPAPEHASPPLRVGVSSSGW